jgi:hypothetical protein
MNQRERSGLNRAIFWKGSEESALILLPLALFYLRKLALFPVHEVTARVQI